MDSLDWFESKTQKNKKIWRANHENFWLLEMFTAGKTQLKDERNVLG